jgi:hypothetical protein
MFVRSALKVITQNGGEFMYVILLYRVDYTTVWTVTNKTLIKFLNRAVCACMREVPGSNLNVDISYPA